MNKVYIGDLDGEYEGLLITSSQQKGCWIAGCSLADFQKYFKSQRISKTYQDFEEETLYIRKSKNEEWQKDK